MNRIGLQEKARPRVGAIERYWFENPNVGLARICFHRIVVPFEPFDSGLDYVSQPEATELVIEWLALELSDPSQLDGVAIADDEPAGMEASIYLGGAHNWVTVHRLSLREEGTRFKVECEATVDFATEGVGKNEQFRFEAFAVYRGEA